MQRGPYHILYVAAFGTGGSVRSLAELVGDSEALADAISRLLADR
jgi:hypothetical protein